MGRKNQGGGVASLRHASNLQQTTLDEHLYRKQQQGTDIQVDSWRSYKNDSSSSLQITINGAQPQLNPTAIPFIPGNGSQFPSRFQNATRQPLRSSKTSGNGRGTTQRRTHHTDTRTEFYDPTVRDFGTNLSGGRNPDEPIRSVETISKKDKATSVPKKNSLSVQIDNRTVRSKSRTVTPPPTPKLSEEYRKQALQPPTQMSKNDSPRKLLVILDLNGTLLFRPNRKGAPTNIRIRPGVESFLDYLFTNHVVMIYTSARPENATGIVDKLLHPKQRRQVAAIWARDKLDLSAKQYNQKVQVYKKLGKVWSDAEIQSTVPGGVEKWGQHNTILIDDSRTKALAQPHNLLQVPEYTKADLPLPQKTNWRNAEIDAMANAVKVQTQIMEQLQMKIEELKWQEDVSRLIRAWQEGEANVPCVDGQEVSVDETMDVKDMSSTSMQQQNQQEAEGDEVAAEAARPASKSEAFVSNNTLTKPGTTEYNNESLEDLMNRISAMKSLSSDW